MKQIVESIKKGLISAYEQNKEFKTELFEVQHKITEYLFTVNVAQELLKDNIQKLLPNISIHLEYNSQNFLENAFPKFKWVGDGSAKVIKRNTHNTCRPGRVDIVLLKYEHQNIFNKRSVFGIEIKPLIRNHKKLWDDLSRLVQALTEEDPVAPNSIEKCYLGFGVKLSTRKKLLMEKDFIPLKEKFLNTLNDFLVGEFGNEVIFEITDFLVDLNTAEQEADSTPEEFWDTDDFAVKSGAILGIIIELQRK